MAAMQAESRIGELWQQRIAGLQGVQRCPRRECFGAGLAGSCLFSSEYDRARALLGRLLSEYDGASFESLFPGSLIDTENGTCLSLEHREAFSVPNLDTGRLDEEMLCDLTLVKGIGERSEARLKARGWKTIADLAGHPRFRYAAREVLERLSRDDPREVMDLAGSRHAKSHPFVLGAAGAFAKEDYVFLDIETLGLFLPAHHPLRGRDD